MSATIELIEPDCFSSSHIRACFTTRIGGCSKMPWESFNLAIHVGDDPDAVRRNRNLLTETLQLPEEPCWLDQTHGNRVVRIDAPTKNLDADASTSTTPGRICAILLADCVPLLICDRAGSQVAAVHAGWRGLDAGVIAAAVAAFAVQPAHLIAWIGPAISADAYQVGADLRHRFIAASTENEAVFDKHGANWHMDLVGLACRQLTRAGVESITVSEHCVHRQGELFYSHRRDGSTGRMAALIWIDPH